MRGKSWPDAFDELLSQLVRIETPGGGHGTGFRAATRMMDGTSHCVIVTAWHVIEGAMAKGESLKMQLLGHDRGFTAKSGDLKILAEPDRDIALIHCHEGCLPFSGPLPHLAAPRVRFRPGSEIAWCGFPHVEGLGSKTACFFWGHVSAVWTEHADYLIDGVAIHGVSGGPVFRCEGQTVVVVGLITNYIPNLALRGAALPGVSLARTIEDVVEQFQRPTPRPDGGTVATKVNTREHR